MSRGYSRVNSRKANAASQASIQFDKLLNDNSNRPCASKSSGTVGKWGVISCTSIRSTNLRGRRDEPLGSKRKRADLNSRPMKLSIPPEDPFSFETDLGDGSKGHQLLGDQPSPVKPVIKPKKFFKSRNTEAVPSADVSTNLPVFAETNQTGTAMYSGKKTAKDSNLTDTAAVSKKFFTSKKSSVEPVSSEQTEAMNLSSPNKSPSPTKAEHKPPIVLRIFKGTSHLVNESDNKLSPTSVTKPPFTEEGNNTNVRTTRSGRTTRNYSELDDDEDEDDFSPLCASVENRRGRSTSISRSSNIKESPKRSRRTKASATGRYAAVTPLLPTDGNNSSEEVEVDKVDNASKDVCQDIQDELNVSNADTIPISSQDTGLGSMSSSFMLTPISQEEAKPIICKLDTLSEPIPNDLKIKEDEEKLLRAEELLASTYVDFNSATEKLLQPQDKTSDISTTAKAEWYSDSDESNCGTDQLATLPSSADDLNSSKTDIETKLELDVSADGSVERTTSPARKKGSIFKSRSLLAGGSHKRLALYKHKWSDNDKQGNNSTAAAQSAPPPNASVFSELDEEAKLTRVTSWPMTDVDDLQLEDAEAITSIKCTKKAKGFYTVVRNVKKAHQIQESGEFQEFNDDVEYLLDALQDTSPMGTRCLSAITLASKCMAPAFRMHVRAHGTVAKFFRALHDATKDQSLGLCTATVMFVLSQDRLNMDLDRHSLELMLNLLESDVSHRHALEACGLTDMQLHKNKQKVRELCEEIQSQGHAKHLNLDNITVGHLAMETLLSLTSRRAGEWFKEELRELGGLEHIVKTICECCRQVDDYVVEWTDTLLDKLRKVDRCLRVLENVTYQNEENQLYLLRYGDGVLLDTLVKLFRQCDAEIPLYPVTDMADKESTGAVIREVLLATLRVLINLTHDFNKKSYGSALAGERKGIIDSSLHLLLQVPDYIPDEKKFDLLVLALILLINLVEHCQPNRKLLFEAKAPSEPASVFNSCDKTAVEALIDLFHQQEEHARKEEMKTDAILDGKKDAEEPEAIAEKPKTQEEFMEETVAKLIQKAGQHMEHTLISAYVGLLLGSVIMDNMYYETYVRQCLPDKSFVTMIAVLQKVYNFMTLTASAVGSSRGIAQLEGVIQLMTKSDKLVLAAVEAGSGRSEELDHSERFSQ